jgi:uncharacterized membrane protein YqjE
MSDDRTTSTPGREPTVADLVGQATSQISALVRDELALARLEFARKARRAGLGGGLFGAAGVLAVFGLGLLIALFVVVLDLIWPLWASILVVMGAVLAAAAVASVLARREFKAATQPLPIQTFDSVKADVQAVTEAIQEGRHQ